ncbi:MAG: glucose-1-phosphate adenylyltransferase subunit GlgD [Firmicutes bacterium HGW-Firmicutes-21]|nr:MAG: glucose-1-phosphate adenylyltransferase subunit GlgD [Firmicutes bacterium HGW-Firmicutes-21]
MSVVGIIFSNIHDKNISELTRMRTMASVPFGCRYRLIDFTLSNMVNSGITHVGVITHYNYQSLMDHIGTGKDWDLARRQGGIQILPPYITAFANTQNSLYTTRLEALKSINAFISGCTEEYVVLSDCDLICNIDLDAMIKHHIETGADATFAIKSSYIAASDRNSISIIEYNENCRVTDITEHTGYVGGFKDINLNIWVMRRKYLEDIIQDAIAHNYTDFTKDVIVRNLSGADFRVYKYDCYFASVSSLADYYFCSMDLLNADTRRALFGVNNRSIFTKVRNSAPSIYSSDAQVKNSLIADGCVIEGTVENSILFRGVKVGTGTHIKNSILMQDTLTGDNIYLNCVITDKNVVIRDGRVLSGHETRPFYIEKNSYI